MIRNALTPYALPMFNIIGLLFFAAFFIGILFWINREDSKKKYIALGALPLEKSDE